MASYGTSSDATYSQTLTGLDEIMSTLAYNETGAITSRNLRDVSFTLWEQISGIQTWSFSYSSLTPSVVDVGGITAGNTFVNETLENLFYRIFNPYQDPEYSLTVVTPDPPIFEYGYSPGGTGPDAVLRVDLTKTTNPILSCTLSLPYNTTVVVSPGIPTTGSTTSLFTGIVNPDEITSFILTLDDVNGSSGQSGRQIAATVSWYSSRYFGSIDCTSISPYFDVRTMTATQSITLDSLIDARLGITGSESLGSLSTSPYSLLGTTVSLTSDMNHLIIAWPSSDWNYTLFPRTNYNGLYVNMFKKIKSNYSLINVYGYGPVDYDVYMSFIPQGDTEITILNQQQ